MTLQGPHEGLGRGQRLTRRPDFLAVQQRGRRVVGEHYLLLALPRAGASRDGRARLGVTVSKRVGKAVQRNRVKRWVRESYRRMSELAPTGTDLVVVARPTSCEAGYRRTASEIESLLRRLGKR